MQNNINKCYSSPEVEVVATHVRNVICQSPDIIGEQLQDYEGDSWNE